MVVPELAAGTLVPLLTSWNQEWVDIQLFIPQDRVKRAPVRAVADFLRDRIDWSGQDTL